MDNYQLVGQTLGNGNYGTVQVAACRKTGKKYALKRLKYTKAYLLQRFPNFKRELDAMQKLKHPNIVGLVDNFEDKQNKVCIVMENCAKGDLTKYMFGLETDLTSTQKLKLFGQILQGMDYIHEKGFMHRDLKPDNVLVTQDLTAKIGDFGMMKEFQNQLKNTIAGTPLYSSPQMLNRSGKYTKKCDVFSTGLILYFILFKKDLFGQARDMEDLIHRQEITQESKLGKFVGSLKCDIKFKQLLIKSLCYKEQDRFSMKDLRNLFVQSMKSHTCEEVVPLNNLDEIEEYFGTAYKKISRVDTLNGILVQLSSNKNPKLKTVKRYVLIYLIGCHLVQELVVLETVMKTSDVASKQFQKVKTYWIARVVSNIKEYKPMCLEAAQLIASKKNHKFFWQNQSILKDAQQFIVSNTPTIVNYPAIIKTLVEAEITHQKQAPNGKLGILGLLNESF